MKKLSYLFLALIIVACGSDDSDNIECFGTVTSWGSGTEWGVRYHWVNIINLEGESEREYVDVSVYSCYARALTDNDDDCYRGKYWDCETQD
tara:strand:+ start:330 stop:605 length:276 start_codon:yes stop_codon:yes gene_type:complete